MSRFKNRLVKRVMAVILSGAMVMSCMPSSNMTAFASEAPSDTGGGYFSEMEDVGREDDADIEMAEKEDAVDDKSTNVSSKEETTSKDEDNVSSDKKDAEDTAKETVAADKDAEADAVEDDKASETESSLSEEVEEDESEEKDEKSEDVKVGGLQEMESGQTYSFSADDLTVGNITGVQLLGNDYFALQCSDATKVEAGAKTFRRFYAATNQIAGVEITNRIYLGGEGTTSSQSIKFITKESVDVIVYWVSNGADAQMTILNDDGETVAKTFKAAANDGILVSRMTLGKTGTYYLEGNSYIYKVEVMPASNSKLETDWDFTNDTKFPVTTAVPDTGNKTSIESKTAEEFHGLYIDTTGGGKWKKNSGKVQVNDGTIIYIPLEKRSTVTINFGGGQYTVDGVASTGDKSTFTCVGEGGYATVKVTTGSTNFYSIKVEPIETIKVEGDITLSPTKTDPYEIIFTEKTQKDDAPKSVIKGKVENNHYTVDLYKGLTYIVSFSDKSYNVTKNGEITIAENEPANKTWDVEAEAMSLTDVTGSIKFLDENGQEISIPDDLKLKFTSKGEGTPHIPDVTIDKTAKTYSVSLENDSTYTVTAEAANVEDYTYVPKELKADSPDKTITFTEKPRHAINITVNSFDNRMDVSNSEITFTNVNEEGYQYSFTGIENVTLRDGTYSVSMDVKYPYKLDTSKNLVVSGAAKNYTLNFEERMAWDFTEGDPMLKLDNALQNKPEEEFHGLLIDTSKKTLTGSFTDASGNSTTTFETNGKFDVQTSGRVQVNSSTEIKIPVSGKGTVKIVNQVASDTNHYTIDGVKATTEPQTWSYNKPAASYSENGEYIPGGYITLQVIKTKLSTDNGGTIAYTHSDSIYLQKIIVEREKEIITPIGSKKIDVWDFGGKVETNTNKYTNNITPQKWIDSNLLIANGETTGTKGRFRGASTQSYTYSFGDLTMYYVGEDRLYSNLSELTNIVAGATGNGSDNAYADGYTAAGGWYGNGSGSDNTTDLTKADTRNITIKAAAGDTIVLYAGQHMSNSNENEFGPITYHFEGAGQHDSQALSNNTGRVYQKLVFVAEHTGIYKIWPECENKGKPMYNRVMRIPSVNVSGTINFGAYTGTGHTVKFVNETTGAESIAELDGTNFTVSLAPGYQYTAVLSGAPGYGFASEGKTIKPTEDDIASGITNVSLTVEAKNMCTYSGKITGFAADYNTGRLSIMMTPPEDSKADPVRLDIKEDLSFEAELESNVQYVLQLNGVDDYEIKSALVVKATADLTDDIQVGLKPTYTVSGSFIGLEDAEVTELTFTLLNEEGAEDSNYVYKAAIANGAYTVRLRDGAYLAKAVVTGYKTQTHVVVNGENVEKGLLFVSTAADTALARVAHIYVGYPSKSNNYSTIRDAVKAAKRMNPGSEEQRITIHIAPGTYREQINVDVPYITFINDEPSREVLITWYYGIGYKYYSADSTGWYNEECAYDKYQKNGGRNENVTRWGVTVNLTKNATAFHAEGITFENSFNRYVTDEELEDGVEISGKEAITFERKRGVDVRSKAATERAAALYIDNADHVEFYKCSFHSSQDTLGTGGESGNKNHAYFKECVIEGNTDYICGDGDVVFEDCELRFAGYSTGSQGGYITAAQSVKSEHGYLFMNCKVTGSKELTVTPGYLGRPWRQPAKVIFANTQLETANIITGDGWTDMSGATVDKAAFVEYNTTALDGGTIPITAVRQGKMVTENPVTDITTFFDSWEPFYFTYNPSQNVKEPVSSENRSDVPTGTTITLSCATADAKIYYTTDGNDPTAASTEYTEPIELGNEERTVTIKAIAIKGAVQSNIAVFEYNVKSPTNLIAAPTASVESGVVEAGTVVLLNCATNGAAIYFTIDGSEPEVDNNLLYRNQAILIYETKTIKAIAVKDTNKSEPVTFEYRVKPTITAEPGDGTAFPSTGGAVTLTASKGAKIYYTISATQDGLTDPADKSNTKREEYTGTPIQIKEETYIWAVAVSGDLTSDALKYHYTVLEKGEVVKPVADPDGSEAVESGTVVTLTVTDNTVEYIYYTTDGSDPTTSDTRKTYNPVAGIEITEAVTIKAAAQKGDTYSEVATFVYTISSGGNTPGDSEKPKDPVAITLDDCEVVVPSVIQKKATDPIKPETYVTYKGYRFVAGLDYSVSDVSGPDSDGYYSVTLTGLERDNNGRMEETYKIAASPTRTEKFKVVSAPKKGDTSVVDFSKAKVSLNALAKNAVYTGSAIEPKLDADPKKDKDGLVTKLGDRINYAYKNNINAGKATVTISVKPPKDTDVDQTIYAGSKTFTFNIKKAALNKNQDKNPEKATAKVVYENPDNLDYKGNGVGIELKSCKVTVGTTPNVVELKKDRDYTITYKNNAKAGKATVTVKGIGNNVSGSWSTDYTITALKLEELTINAADQTMYYSPKGAKLGTITAKKGSDTYTLKEGTDFTAKYVYGEKTKAAGTDVEVTISGKNGCTGKNIAIADKITIVQADFGKCISVSSDVVLDKTTKTGKEQAALAKTLAVTDTSGAKLKLDKDYKMTLKTDDETKAPIVVIEPKDETNSNYKGSKTVSYRVAANLAKEKTFVMDKNLEKTDPLSYDGRNPVQITQRDIDKYINTPNNTNYKLGTNIRIVPGTYKNNTKKGTAQVTVQGIGEFYGTKVLKFKIVEK